VTVAVVAGGGGVRETTIGVGSWLLSCARAAATNPSKVTLKRRKNTG
jgi:hypothetical protein